MEQKPPHSRVVDALNEFNKNGTALCVEYYGHSQPLPWEALKILAETMRNSPKLQILALYKDTVGDEGARSFAEVLAQHPGLLTLKFRYSQIGDDGAAALADALANNTRLEYLDLSENPFGARGVHALRLAMEHNTTLVYLRLDKVAYVDTWNSKPADRIARAHAPLRADIDFIEKQLKANRARRYQQWCRIFAAIEQNDLHKFIHRIAHRNIRNISQKGTQYRCIHVAAAHGARRILRYLICKMKLSPDMGTPGNHPGTGYEGYGLDTPLHVAVVHEQWSAAALLLELGANPNQINGYGHPPLPANQKHWPNQLKIFLGLPVAPPPGFFGKLFSFWWHDTPPPPITITPTRLPTVSRYPVPASAFSAPASQQRTSPRAADGTKKSAAIHLDSKPASTLPLPAAIPGDDRSAVQGSTSSSTTPPQRKDKEKIEEEHEMPTENRGAPGAPQEGTSATTTTSQPAPPAEAKEDYQPIDPQEVLVGKVLGKGNFGVVYEGKWNGAKVALKEIANTPRSLREATTLKKFCAPSVVTFYGVTAVNESAYLVMEYCILGNLLNYLKNTPQVAWETVYMFSENIANALKYLHEKNYTHNDIAARNVFLAHDSEGHLRAKLGDFGLTRPEGYFKTSTTGLDMSIPWTAFEVLQTQVPTKQSDMFSYGVVLWELATRGAIEPLAQLKNEKPALKNPLYMIHYLTTQAHYCDPIPAQTPLGFFQLIHACRNVKAAERPNANQVLNALALIKQDQTPYSPHFFQSGSSAQTSNGEGCSANTWRGQ